MANFAILKQNFLHGFFDINETTKPFRVARLYLALKKKEIKLVAIATILFI